MPVDKQVLLRYQVLNKCFRNRYREFTIEDLVEECNKALRAIDKPNVSKRTIQNDINTLEADYGIMLDEKLKRGRQRLYRYTDTNYSLRLFRMNDEERNKIQGAIDVLNYYSGEPIYDWVRTFLMQIEGGAFDENSSSVVSFQTNPDLKGLSLFGKLLQAIITKRTLKIWYTPYGKKTLEENIFPYHLKQFNDRWYLIAQIKGYTSMTHYALDRIERFEEVAIPYQETDIDFSEYFDDVIGVTVPDKESETIIIRVNRKRYDYIKTKPLHLSQRLIEENDIFATISIDVKINKELEALLLSYGSDLEVLSPEYFRIQIAKKIEAMNQKYLNDEENLHGK